MQWRLGDIWSVATFNLFITTQSKGLFACLLLSTTPHPASGSFWCLAFFRKSVPIWHESLMMMMQKLFSPGPLCLSFFRKIRSHWSWITDDAAKAIFNLPLMSFFLPKDPFPLVMNQWWCCKNYFQSHHEGKLPTVHSTLHTPSCTDFNGGSHQNISRIYRNV